MYFCVITLTTVGFGDFVPSNPWSRVGVFFFAAVRQELIFFPLQDLFFGCFSTTSQPLLKNKALRPPYFTILHAPSRSQGGLGLLGILLGCIGDFVKVRGKQYFRSPFLTFPYAS